MMCVNFIGTMGKKRGQKQGRGKGQKNADIDEVIPSFLYLGSAKLSRDKDSLLDVGITHIVSLAGKVAFPHDFEYMKAHIPDSAHVEVAPCLPAIFAFVNRAKQGARHTLQELEQRYWHAVSG